MKELNQNHTVGYLFKQALEKKIASDLSEKHKNNLRRLYTHFMVFLGPEGRDISLHELSTPQIELFLERYNSSATNYMNMRRNLSVLFNVAARLIDENLLTIKRRITKDQSKTQPGL